MAKIHPRQLELPVMVDVNRKSLADEANASIMKAASYPRVVDTGLHRPASADDQSIYKAISDHYFNSTVKQK